MIERYMDGKLARIWSLDRTYARWFAVEVEHVREISGAPAAEWMEQVGPPRESEVRYQEKTTGHDVAAFLVALDLRMQRKTDDEGQAFKARSALHYGLTSSDVTDTALSMAVLDSHLVVREHSQALGDALHDFLLGLGPLDTTIGRTHGQLAAPMPADHRWGVLEEMFDRARTRVETGFAWMDVGKLSGPVGDRTSGEEERALTRLGLRSATATQLIPRDRLAHLAHCLAEMATVCEAIVTQVWLLAQAGIDEIRVSPVGTVGSSAMPHKVNPILAENVRGLARMARANAETLQLGIVQWGEHDLAHSSVERVALPDLLHLVVAALSRTAALVSGLSWKKPTIPPDYQDTGEWLRVAQANGQPYVDAHATMTQAYRDGKIPMNEASVREDGGN